MNGKTYKLATGGTVEVTILRGGEERVADIHIRAEDGRSVATVYRSVREAEEMVAGLEEVPAA
ncbi:hypothetical protein PBI_NESBITT_44 [Streptomyces phage Nesbitt]|uniref:Uncharacterized protein n=2 Tax=Abbeymikolonvirus abbeymikolon TaxID=2734213 RepID=A0A2P1JT42_9CAUD|nr:hypothetical protein HOS57_gp46 [Streptomyces phage AbbeyMikolon]AUG87117.1 hypothetical protein SEA_ABBEYMIKOLON_46 [Streptomyces phage AbbeyMikolon]AVO22301.1 hypothetical protein PBI_NESBITT_44 [Streptomyces phage Nesbitt]